MATRGTMKMRFMGTFAGLFPTMLLLFAIVGAPVPSPPGKPGTLNAVVGNAWIDEVPVNQLKAGLIRVDAGQQARTKQGMVEILLNPGSIFRLGERSKVTLQELEKTETRVRLEKGQALVEVLQP